MDDADDGFDLGDASHLSRSSNAGFFTRQVVARPWQALSVVSDGTRCACPFRARSLSHLV
ncbi:MAG: hypothetical protein ACRDLY_00330 [Thermoleophilaceae bacterium]